MPEYALTLHFGAPDDEHARKRADDIADVCAAEHGTRDPVVVPVVASEMERLRGELAAAELNRDMARAGAEGLRRELKAALQRAEQAEDRLRVTADAYTRLHAQADAAEAARARWQERGKQAEAAVERVRALHSPRDRGAGPECMGCRTHVTFTPYEKCKTIAALDAPSGAEKTEDASSADRWSCPRCGSDRWVAASLTGPVEYGGRAIKQCVPCGYYSGDSADAPSRADSHQDTPR